MQNHENEGYITIAATARFSQTSGAALMQIKCMHEIQKKYKDSQQ